MKTHLVLSSLLGVALSAAWVQASGIDTPSNILPPLDGRYLSPQDVHAQYGTNLDALKLLFKRPEHHVILCEQHSGAPGGMNTKFPDPVLGPHEAETFCSEAKGKGEVFAPGGNPSSTGEFNIQTTNTFLPNVRTVVENRYDALGNLRDTGVFDTEMLQLDLQGTVNVPGLGTHTFMIRESPTLPSRGKTTISGPAGGPYHIDSFFDVFTEISIDGGPYIPSTGSNRMELVPEPSSIVMASLGALGLLGYAIRRRRTA